METEMEMKIEQAAAHAYGSRFELLCGLLSARICRVRSTLARTPSEAVAVSARIGTSGKLDPVCVSVLARRGAGQLETGGASRYGSNSIHMRRVPSAR